MLQAFHPRVSIPFAGLKFNALRLEVSILCVFAPLRALRETKNFAPSCLCVSIPSLLRVKKMRQAFHLSVSIPFAFLAPLRETNSFFPTFAVQKS
jgi:hypothetical protein